MPDQTIKCPKCGAKIPLSEALTNQIEDSIRAQYEVEAAKKSQEFEKEKQALKKQRKELEKQKQAIEEQVAEQVKDERKKIAEEKKVLETQRQEIDDRVAEQVKAERKKIADQKKALEVKRQQIDDEIAEKEKELRSSITKQLRAKLAEEQAEQTKTLEQELEEKRKEVAEANKRELELRKQQQKLEEEKASIKLTVQRQLDEERKKIFEDAGQKAAEEQQFKIREKDDLIKAMQGQIETLKRRAETGSQEAQGEALEGALQDMLQQTFPFDLFEGVKKGQRGADILQIVHNATGKECGKILWESKYTKDFQKGWIEKLKRDQQEAGAEIAVITTITLPKEIKNFGPMENVWITDFASAMGLSAALRMGLINAAREKALTENKETLKDVIYKYVTGQEFSMQIRAVAEAFIRMQGDLNKEKRAMERIWKSREKQIETVLSNLAGIRGSLEGYVGQKLLPSMETLSLEAIETDETEA